DFELPSADGAPVKLADLDGPALLVMFLCNHCPYVRHVEQALAATVADYAGRGVAAVAICSNDLDAHPDDGPAGMAEQARRAGFGFPSLLDETQEVAAAYRAMCTPDLFVYDAERRLAYRGAFDDSTPRNSPPVTGAPARCCGAPWPGSLTASRCPSPTARAWAAASSGRTPTGRPGCSAPSERRRQGGDRGQDGAGHRGRVRARGGHGPDGRRGGRVGGGGRRRRR